MPASHHIPWDDLIRVRRQLHRRPELSLLEHDTAAFVVAELEKLTLDDLRVGVGRTGVLGTLRGGKQGPVTLLRADMDALPIAELADVEYRSERSGVMHACGHDGHVSILLAAARALAARRAEVCGTLVFCFQPGEEGSAGNRLMIEDGALENPHVDRTFALHLYSGLDVGKIGVRDGAFFASADEYTLAVRGQGGHGGMPQFANDPILAGAHLVTLLQSIVSREIAPKDPAVFTVGAFNAGTTFNVIPDEAILRGTVRCFDAGVRAAMPQRLERITRGLGEALRVDYDLDYRWSYPPTVNDRATNDVVREVGRDVLGAENVVEHEIVMWAEDMSFMQEKRPGAYFIVGSRGAPASAFPHHNARFDIDEQALGVGYRMMISLGLHA
ncbi:MAG: M20 family metallopeptidase [Candidatus Eremiobacteraeota bacterium]|nr:M20 family metallopeptidase [Candidatus Eremiobacteraeota bacterium]